MNIIYLHQYFNTPSMNGSTRSYEMARHLALRGHRVVMITSDTRGGTPGFRWRREMVDGIEVHWFGLEYNNTMGYAQRLLAFIAFAIASSARAVMETGDVVYATSTPLTIAVPGILASRLRGRPFVLEVRDLWPDVPIAVGALRSGFAKRLAYWLERVAYRSSRAVVALAPGMKRHVVALGVPDDTVAVIPNGCDLDLFRESASNGRKLRESHPWLGSRRLVLYAGTLGLVNGVDYLVRLASVTRKLDPEIRFVVLGDGREKERVTSLAAELGVLDQNLFMFSSMPKSEVASWMSAADVTTSLIIDREYLYENAVTNKFFDSLAAGRPCLSNHPGFQSEVAEEAGAGLTLSADPAEAAPLLVGLLHDEEWLDSASAAASLLARTVFNRENLARQLEDVLESVTGVNGVDEQVVSED